jgi:hypothetical protein
MLDGHGEGVGARELHDGDLAGTVPAVIARDFDIEAGTGGQETHGGGRNTTAGQEGGNADGAGASHFRLLQASADTSRGAGNHHMARPRFAQ